LNWSLRFSVFSFVTSTTTMSQPQLIRSLRRAPWVLVLSLLFPLGLTAQINFYGIGDLTNGDTYSQVRDATRVSGHIVAVGTAAQYTTSSPPSGGDTPVKWVQGTGLTTLPEVQNGSNSSAKFAAARVITSDGTIIGDPCTTR